MKKLTLISWIAALMLTSQASFAEAVYPNAPDIRPEGMQQGTEGSCQAEADVGAMEYAFRARGYAVALSTFHAHAFNWKDDTNATPIHQEYSTRDNPIFAHYGRFVPLYMLPEDERGFATPHVKRPAVSELGVYDPEFPTSAQTGQTESWFTFNTVGVAQLKQLVRDKQAVTLSVQSVQMDSYDVQTGFLSMPYQTLPVIHDPSSESRQKISHAVALVGFDDELVAGEGAPRGAFIVKNSWNENSYLINREYVFDPKEMTESQRADFQRMRAKINPNRNEVGYFALPYAYVEYLASQGSGGGNILGIDFAAFYSAYRKAETKYKIRSLPFYCDYSSQKYILNTYPTILKKLRGSDAAKKAEAKDDLNAVFSFRFMAMPGSPVLHVAKIAQAAWADRTHDFYAGKFSKFYCDSHDQDFGPREDALAQPDFAHVLELLEADSTSFTTWLAVYKFVYNYLGDKQ